MPSLPLKQPNFRLQILNLLRQKLDQILQIALLLIHIILLILILASLNKTIITNNCLLVESNFLFNCICFSPSSVISVITLVFCFLQANRSFFFNWSSCLMYSILLLTSFYSTLYLCLVSKSSFVGSKASRIFRSIVSPNFSNCFSYYYFLLFSISIAAFFT